MTPESILEFWFLRHGPDDWFEKNDAFDASIRDRFSGTYEAVVRGESKGWRESPQGRLAEVLVLDQFARNMFRGTPAAFANDALALSLAKEAVALGADMRVKEIERQFFYMPYMHSEDISVHEEALPLFEKLGNESLLWYENEHRKIIERFGRYPHRNAILGRQSTSEEEEFLKTHQGF